jgi:VanZ family protein
LTRAASAWLPVAFCILVIVGESTPTFGADHTSGPLQWLVELLLHRHFTSPEWMPIHFAIRKSGRFFGYGILSLSWYRAFWMTWWLDQARFLRRIPVHGLAMMGTFLVASGDEVHQHFLPNRNGAFADVMIDCAGALAIQVLIWIWMQWHPNT